MMDVEQLKFVVTGVLLVAFFLFYRRHLKQIYTPEGRINPQAFKAARQAAIMPGFITAGAVAMAGAVVTLSCSTSPEFAAWAPLRGFSPIIIAVPALLGAIWALSRMTAAAAAHKGEELLKSRLDNLD